MFKDKLVYLFCMQAWQPLCVSFVFCLLLALLHFLFVCFLFIVVGDDKCQKLARCCKQRELKNNSMVA